MSQYAEEANNNNSKVTEMLQQIFPEIFTNPDDTKTLMKVEQAIGFIREKTNYGTILIHVEPKGLLVEGRFKWPEMKVETLE